MFTIEKHLELLRAAVVPLVVHRSPDTEALPEHLDAEAAVGTASKPIQSGDGDEGYIEYRNEEVGDFFFHFSCGWGLLLEIIFERWCLPFQTQAPA